MDRRHFASLVAAALAGDRLLAQPSSRPTFDTRLSAARMPLWRAPELRPAGITLRANAHRVATGAGTTGRATDDAVAVDVVRLRDGA